MAFPKSSLPAAVTEWGSENGPFPDLTAFGLAVSFLYYYQHPPDLLLTVRSHSIGRNESTRSISSGNILSVAISLL